MPCEPDAFEAHLDASSFNVRRDSDSAPRTGTQHADEDATRKSAHQRKIHHHDPTKRNKSVGPPFPVHRDRANRVAILVNQGRVFDHQRTPVGAITQI